jgi:glycosyltransferase involved in cell wall biosynthesis
MIEHMLDSVSAIVLTRNEEQNIARCLNSLRWVHEIVVVDAESTDSTVKIAESHDARVFIQPWLGVGHQYQYAADKATSEWILAVDADEEVTPELKDEILHAVSGPSPHAAYRIPRVNFALGRWLRYGGWKEDLTRLFQKKHAAYLPRNHPQLDIRGTTGSLRNPIRHYMATDFLKWWVRSLSLARIEAETRYCEGERFSSLKLLASFWKFIRRYTFKLGFLDGWPGFYCCFQRFLYMAAMQACFLELQRGIRKPSEIPHTETFK